ncbi:MULTISPECIES: M1 family metallopeptidase [Idiomarinaceae]|uniref:Aminopeptidase N n=1 Tax=Pseudidiomarina fusca TaxID=2965078 RepID=A0ABU3KWB9_9GAMM|nr:MULTISPECIES: M1 family metallopeptidase [Idiomarinaceae]MDT7525789.1 M1 family metallopeptidase [Pseudidiomarina sp. GXY010]MRJ42475.1 aminopeptidase [Idiomarina sp. FeN1]NCU58089.1 aminopeptidase [Idiomarina sp. FenA--70]NCU60787.1 aminopeptidase [Idiomarina sp. FenBw--71]UUN13726.1 M1 family metallopeptidase [Idiomarina loihiensis]
MLFSKQWFLFIAMAIVGLFSSTAAAEDAHSYARLDEVSTPHLELDLAIDFDRKQLRGFAEYSLQRHSNSNLLYLDSSQLTIDKAEIWQHDQWQPTKFSLGDVHPSLGQELIVDIGSTATKVRIHYHTATTASGLQWLTPAQTAGKKHPFMFSQSQPIHSRSWIPIQDTPALRLTYNARLTTPAGLLAVMSADNSLSDNRDGEYFFSMPQAIPPYLIAIAAGDLAIQAISDKVAVFAEQYIVDQAAWEFADTPAMIEATEAMYGPYRWDRYDLLILPPSFPFGGMENPRLSFITPTVVSGDRSLINLIAHELAHSWSGNLVTNASWRDLWINEGFTSYVENRIMEALFGTERAVMEQALGYQDLLANLELLEPNDTILNIDLGTRHPDDVFSQVPYVKGQLFLMYLEEQFGRETFDKFLRQYFDDFAFQSISTAQFKAYLQRELLAKHPQVVSMDKINEWIHQPGLPEDAPKPQSDAFAKVEQQMNRWLKGGALQTDSWTTHEWLHFINNLPLDISADNMARLDRQFNLTSIQNSEIAHAWLKLSIIKKYEPARDRLRSYLLTIGRNKLVSPLYRELAKTPDNLKWARAVYEQAKPGYHPLTQTVNEALLYNKD